MPRCSIMAWPHRSWADGLAPQLFDVSVLHPLITRRFRWPACVLVWSQDDVYEVSGGHPRSGGGVAATAVDQYMAMQDAPGSSAAYGEGENVYDGIDAPATPWLWGQINRKEADAALAAYKGEDGTFLVRSRGGGNQYALSLTANGKFEHHVLTTDGRGQFTINGKALSRPCYELADVVTFLRTNDDTTLVSARLQRGLPAR